MDMSVNIAGVEWKNPVTVASGTFGSGEEFSEYVDLNRLGAVTTKGVANVPWSGNPTPRVAEVYGGMMNAIGLQNPGIDLFCKRDIPFLKQYDTKIIVNVCGHAPEEYLAVVERLADEPIDMMEINISCPNVNAGFLAFGQDAHHVEELTGQIKKIAKQPVIMKLTPNVTDITEIAKAAEAGGADAVSLINTLTGMKIDINRKTFALANKTGGVSGLIVKPIAVRMVYQVAQAVNIPIIGMGGISCAEDAIEFILAGASAVSVGTANFHNPAVTMEVKRFLIRKRYGWYCQIVNLLIYHLKVTEPFAIIRADKGVRRKKYFFWRLLRKIKKRKKKGGCYYERRRHWIYVDLHGTGIFYDTGSCLFLWRAGAKKKCGKYHDGVYLYHGTFRSYVDTFRIFPLFWWQSRRNNR